MDNDDNDDITYTHEGSLSANLINTSTLTINDRAVWSTDLTESGKRAEIVTTESDEIKALKILLEAIDMLPEDNDLKQTFNLLRASIKLQGE